MKKLLAVLVTAALFLVPLNAVAAVKAGDTCKKVGTTATANGKKYSCIKSGKKLVWNKGVAVAPKPTPTPTVTPTPTPTVSPTVKPLVEGDSCVTIGETVSNSTGYLECRARDGNRQQYFQLSKSFVPLQIPNTSDPLTTCQLRDQRPVTNAYFWQEYRAVAYPAKPERGFVNSGEQKIVIVGIDFVDAPGVGSPKSILEETIKNSSGWIKWYSQNKLSWNFVTYDKWIRAHPENRKS